MPIYHHTNPAQPPTINHYFSGANGQYFDAQSLARIVQGFIDAHPDLVETINLPNKTYGYDGAATTAHDGQPVDSNRIQMKLYRIHGTNDCAKHGIFVYGSPHSREWVPKHALIEAIYRVLKNYGSDAYLTQLLDEVDIFYIPDANPDGSMYSFHDSANFRRNRHVSGGAPESWPCTTDNNCKVDINRNYSVGFGSGSSSSSCNNEAYHGVCRLSEPETQNISWVVKQYPKIWVSITCHSAGNQIFWPVAPSGMMPQLDSADAKSQSPDEILGGTTLQRSGWFNYMAQRARAALYDHRSTILDQDGFTPGPMPTSTPFGSGISTYEMYFNHTDNPLTDRYKTVKSTQWYEHPHKVYQYTFEVSSVGQRPAWAEADELIMEWANAILEVVACTRDLSKEEVFELTPVVTEDWLHGTFNDSDRSRAWASDWRTSGDFEMLTDFYCHSGTHSVRLMKAGRLERTLDLSGNLGAKLTFAWRAASWESSDKVYVKVNDGTGWTTVKTFSDGDDDYYYHNAEIDLSSFNPTADFKIAFEGAMSTTSDWFYVDHIAVTGYRALAFDDFNSNGFAGGQGWLGNWTTSGTSVSIDTDYPLEGGYCAKILQTGKMERQLDLSGVLNPKLVFDSRSVYFETGDEAYVQVDDGTGVTTVLTIKPEDCDKVYHQHVIDLSGFARSTNFKVIFVGAMSSTTDYWYIDRVRVTGDKAIALDTFDSQDFNGGSGFAFAWDVSGATISKTQQFSGDACTAFSNNAKIERTVDLSGKNNTQLTFVACIDNTFVSGDEFYVKVNDGSGWVTVKTFTSADGDGYYHKITIDLGSYNHVADFKIAFEGGMSTTGALTHIDNVMVV